MKILKVKAQLFHMDGMTYERKEGQTNRRTERERWTDMTKLIVVFGKFENAPKNK